MTPPKKKAKIGITGASGVLGTILCDKLKSSGVDFSCFKVDLRSKSDIAQWLGGGSLDKIIDYYFLEYIEKNPCPFKDEYNRCMIYEVRPLNCRLFGHWKKEDYNKNLANVTKRNIEYRDLIKSKYGFDISDKIVNYKINYCESFVPEYKYLTKSQRLEFADKLMTLDSNIYAKGIIDIDFKDRGIVEYFIDALLNEKISYNIKIRVSKDYEIRNRTINRLERILL